MTAAVQHNRRKEDQSGVIATWLWKYWPFILSVILVGITYIKQSESFSIGAVNRQTSIEKIETKIDSINTKLQEISICLEGQRKDIEYLKRSNNGGLWRENKSTVNNQ